MFLPHWNRDSEFTLRSDQVRQFYDRMSIASIYFTDGITLGTKLWDQSSRIAMGKQAQNQCRIEGQSS